MNSGSGKPHLRYDERPEDDTPVHTDGLPPTPQRDRNVPAPSVGADLVLLGNVWIPHGVFIAGAGIRDPGTG